jgi:predicted hotdog family 3-hydroxylacyl-ACP dehydratase
MRLDRTWIEDHIPHKGRMCLLDEVLQWDERLICCIASNHRLPDHPLRAHGRLGAACGVEYALQAMAIHGSLLAPQGVVPASIGYLVSLHAVTLNVPDLDRIDAPLIATAERHSADSRLALYEFAVNGAERHLLSGRATLVLDGTTLG